MYAFSIADSRDTCNRDMCHCDTGELRSVKNLWLDDHGHSSYQKVNVRKRMYFELGAIVTVLQFFCILH